MKIERIELVPYTIRDWTNSNLYSTTIKEIIKTDYPKKYIKLYISDVTIVVEGIDWDSEYSIEITKQGLYGLENNSEFLPLK